MWINHYPIHTNCSYTKNVQISNIYTFLWPVQHTKNILASARLWYHFTLCHWPNFRTFTFLQHETHTACRINLIHKVQHHLPQQWQCWYNIIRIQDTTLWPTPAHIRHCVSACGQSSLHCCNVVHGPSLQTLCKYCRISTHMLTSAYGIPAHHSRITVLGQFLNIFAIWTFYEESSKLEKYLLIYKNYFQK